MNEVKFSPNVPQTLALRSPEGELDDRYNRVHYTCVDGRELVISSLVAAKLNALELQAGETFGICKRWTGDRSEPVSWSVWLTPQSEQDRAAQESTVLERQLSESIAQVREIRKQPSASPAELAPTGTEGPAPQRAPRPQRASAAPPVRVPYNVAFREVVQFVTTGLKESGEQWSDQSRQDIVSTILISAAKQGLLSLWERPA